MYSFFFYFSFYSRIFRHACFEKIISETENNLNVNFTMYNFIVYIQFLIYASILIPESLFYNKILQFFQFQIRNFYNACISLKFPRQKKKKNTRTNIYLKIPSKLASLKFQLSTNYLHLDSKQNIPQRKTYTNRNGGKRKKRKEKTEGKQKSKRNSQVVKLTKRKAC